MVCRRRGKYILSFVLEAPEEETVFVAVGGGEPCVHADNIVIVMSPSASEPIHAMTRCTSHVLSRTHFTHLPPHPAPPASYSCCGVEREESRYWSALGFIHTCVFGSFSWLCCASSCIGALRFCKPLHLYSFNDLVFDTQLSSACLWIKFGGYTLSLPTSKV